MNDTKIISARIPLSDYIVLLQQAKEAKMTITDFLIDKLFSESDNKAKQKQEVEILDIQIAQLQEKVIEFENLSSQQNQENKNLNTQIIQLQNKIIEFQQYVDKAKVSILNIKQENHELEKTILDMKNNHNTFVQLMWEKTKAKEGFFLYSDELKRIKEEIWE